jgi:hypothetical protein
MKELLATYTHRFQVKAPYFASHPRRDLGVVIAIPSFKEPDILPTLRSLASCDRPKGSVEVIITLNAPEGSEPSLLEANERTFQQIDLWRRTEKPDFMEVLVIREEHLPIKHAGAGCARKIGMDEAFRRWAMLEKDGPIVCLDADCTVSKNYLTAAEAVFNDPDTDLGHFEFEHLYENEQDEILKKGIVQYELHLRCYVQGLQWAGYPFAVHTVGSCMAVRASAYARAGGMNRRKAGEDFYFMHKLLPVSKFRYLLATVYPSCRVSDRVPFGTGRAQLDWLANEGERLSYDPRVYKLLKILFDKVPEWYENEVDIKWFPEVMRLFLNKMDLPHEVGKMKAQSRSREVFMRRFWQWMDGFMVLKFTHFLRDQAFPNLPVFMAARDLLDQIRASDTRFPVDPRLVKLVSCQV